MVEVWRQCVTAIGSSPQVGGFEYLTVGALRAGGVLREVRVLSTCISAVATEYYLALSGVAEMSAAAFEVASPLMQGPTQFRHLGKAGWQGGVYQFFPAAMIFPMNVVVDSGSRWVMLAWKRSTVRVICVTVTAVVVGLAPLVVFGGDGRAGD